MNRRTFICVFGGSVIAAPFAGQAQPASKTPRVGYVSSNRRLATADAFEQGLRELGYRTGENIRIEYRFGEGRVDRIPVFVDGMLRLRVDVLFAANPYVIRVARQATNTVPIVGIDLETDPIEAGWITSLANPGGNLTGFFLDIPELGGKQLQFVADTVPRLQRVAALWDAPLASAQFRALETAARAARLELQSLAVRQPDEFVAALEAARRQRAQALVVLSSPVVFQHLKRLAEPALRYRLPAISIFPQFAETGGLMGYGPNLLDMYRRSASYVDRILKGARPGDLPIQRPTVFNLAVNVRTARVLGLTMPPSVLGQADQVIE
jgi:putative tryptophan/tyrosine transport system substrate-binding protein